MAPIDVSLTPLTPLDLVVVVVVGGGAGISSGIIVIGIRTSLGIALSERPHDGANGGDAALGARQVVDHGDADRKVKGVGRVRQV